MRSAERDRKLGDPSFIGKRGKKASMRKGRYDGSYTPSEQRLKAKLMRQFIKGFDGPRGNSSAYLDSPVWCACGSGMNRRAVDGSTVACARCAPEAKVMA